MSETKAKITLREATQADIPALAALGRDSFIAKFGHLYSQQNLDTFLGETFTEEAIASELADPGRPPPKMPPNRIWLIFLFVLLANYIVVRFLFPEPEGPNRAVSRPSD